MFKWNPPSPPHMKAREKITSFLSAHQTLHDSAYRSSKRLHLTFFRTFFTRRKDEELGKPGRNLVLRMNSSFQQDQDTRAPEGPPKLPQPPPPPASRRNPHTLACGTVPSPRPATAAPKPLSLPAETGTEALLPLLSRAFVALLLAERLSEIGLEPIPIGSAQVVKEIGLPLPLGGKI